MKEVLVLFYSRNGSVASLAEAAAMGVNTVQGVSATIRTVPAVSDAREEKVGQEAPADTGPLFCDLDDLRRCDALLLGSPVRFGNMAAAMKYFWDGTSALWATGELVDKPAAVFTSSSSLHGGNETTLLSMMLPLLHHGMILAGVPYTQKQLSSTRSGGTPYGASHVELDRGNSLDDDEIAIARGLGKRIAELAVALS